MGVRFDHLVLAVADLDAAIARWRMVGFAPTRGGSHPVGTENALVRGPQPAYVELIAAPGTESNPWLDRVRAHPGALSWAVAVDDLDAARAAAAAAGFDPGPIADGSRTTPAGAVVRWRLCDVAVQPYAADLPFLIEWTEAMAPGPVDGPVLASVTLTPPDADRVADLLLALGFTGDTLFPRRIFRGGDGEPTILLQPLGEPVPRSGATYLSLSSEEEAGPGTAIQVAIARDASIDAVLDGVQVVATADRRAAPAAGLLPLVEEEFTRLRGALADWPNPHPGQAQPADDEYSRCTDPGRYRLLGIRADAWLAVIAERGLGRVDHVEPRSVRWRDASPVVPTRAAVVHGSASGTLPLVVGWAPLEDVADAIVTIGAGDPAERLEFQPDCGCDACDTGSADLLETVDAAFLLVLGGGVLAVRDGDRSVARTFGGWSASGEFARDEPERWLAEAEESASADGGPAASGRADAPGTASAPGREVVRGARWV